MRHRLAPREFDPLRRLQQRRMCEIALEVRDAIGADVRLPRPFFIEDQHASVAKDLHLRRRHHKVTFRIQENTRPVFDEISVGHLRRGYACEQHEGGCDKTPSAMKVHEYQAKEILRRYGVPTPRGIVVDHPEDARGAAKQLGGRVVVKAQIHAGGRGKGGGVKLAKDADEAADLTKKMIGMRLVTKEGNVLALDCKMSFDDNALFRHPDIVEMRDLNEEDPLEVEASKFGLNYIKLDGTVGCMVNGAGLAMATMDIIKLAGGEPANFLDVGGGANAEQIRNAFRILMSDKNVKAVLINIFGGILRCDVLAEGVIVAVTDLGVRVPIVIRMEGTNVEQGKQMLRDSRLNFTTADTMSEAAQRVVALAK